MLLRWLVNVGSWRLITRWVWKCWSLLLFVRYPPCEFFLLSSPRNYWLVLTCWLQCCRSLIRWWLRVLRGPSTSLCLLWCRWLDLLSLLFLDDLKLIIFLDCFSISVRVLLMMSLGCLYSLLWLSLSSGSASSSWSFHALTVEARRVWDCLVCIGLLVIVRALSEAGWFIESPSRGASWTTLLIVPRVVVSIWMVRMRVVKERISLKVDWLHIVLRNLVAERRLFHLFDQSLGCLLYLDVLFEEFNSWKSHSCCGCLW